MISLHNCLVGRGYGLQLSYALPQWHPRFQLSYRIDLDPKFRDEYNEWLRQWFGEEPYIVVVNLADGPKVLMHPYTWERVRNVLKGYKIPVGTCGWGATNET